MAPERFDGRGDARSDVYSLGATLYELLALRPAFEDANRARLVERVLHEEPARPRKLDARIPRDLETTVLKAMAKDPARRYRTAGDFADDLRRFLADRPVRARRSSAAERAWRWCRRNPVVAGLLTAVATLLVAIALVASAMAWRLNREHEDAVANWRDAQEKLARSLLSQARAARLGKQAGRHFEGLKALAEATRLARELDLPQERLLELRNEAIACMALTDVRPARRLEDLAPANLGTGTEVQVAFDSRWEVYARGDPEGNVSVRSLADERELARFSRPLQVAALLLFSPDGHYLVAKYYRQRSEKPVEYVAWDWRQGRELVRQACELNMSTGVDFAFSPDSRQLLVGGRRDGALGIYDLASGRRVRRLELGAAPHWIALSPDGRRLAVEDQGVTVRSLDTGVVLASWRPAANLWSIAWHPDGSLLAAAGADRRIYLWDPATGLQRGVLEGHENAVVRVTFNHDGTLLASHGWDGATRLWDPHGGRELVRVPGHCLNFSPDDQSLAYRVGEELGIWEVAHGRVCRTLYGHRGDLFGVGFSPDGRVLASAAQDGVRLWDAGAARHLGELPGRAGALFHPGGESLFTSGDRRLQRWPLRSAAAEAGQHLRLGPPESLPVPVSGRLERASWDRHGHRLGVVDLWQKGIVLDPKDPTRPTLLVGHDRLASLALSPDGRWAATGTWKGADVKVWDLSQGERPAPAHTIPSDGAVVTFSPDGRWLLVEEGHRCRWFRVGSWVPDHESRKGVCAVAFAADAPVMAERSAAGRPLTLSDPETGRELGTLAAEDTSTIRSVALSRDGGRLAAATTARSIQLWDLRAVRSQLAEAGLDWDPPPYLAAPEARPPLRLTLDLERLRFDQRAKALAARRQLDRTLEQLDRQLEAARSKAEEAALRFRRGVLRARLTRWEPAAADLGRAVQLNPDGQAGYYHLAGVLLWLGDRDLYRNHCQEMLRRFGGTTDPYVAERTAKACLIVPGTVADREQLVRLTERALVGTEAQGGYPWLLQTRGLAECRVGRPEQAIKWVEMGRKRFASPPPVYAALAHLFLSLAYRQLKEDGTARQALGEAARLIDNELPYESSGDLGDGWLDWVFCQAVRREAEGLLARRK
jgi:WD40 repeat protein